MLPMAQLEQVETRYEELLLQMGDPEVLRDPKRLRELGQEQSSLEPLVRAFRELREVLAGIEDTQSLQSDDSSDADPDMAALVEAELEELSSRRDLLSDQIETLLLPKDPRDDKNVIIEIRAGTGGDEAGLFAADLFRMYQRYCDGKRFAVELLSRSTSGIGGFKEVIALIKGKGAFSLLKWESGVHRVQRVPATETQGRIHTSTATVAVLPEADEIDIQIPDNDIRIDVFRSSGPGGQSVNTTDSAVRITHLPTGLVVSSQDEKSQLQNRRRALQVLRARLHEMEEQRQQEEQRSDRRSQVGSGERSEKIRTYNFPQSRVTDHRINLTSHRLEGILSGEIDELIEALAAADRAERLAEAKADSV